MKIKKLILLIVLISSTFVMGVPSSCRADGPQGMFGGAAGCLIIALIIPISIVSSVSDAVDNLLFKFIRIHGKLAMIRRSPIERDQDGRIVKAFIIGRTPIDIRGKTMFVDEGDVCFHKNGSLRSCYTGTETELYIGDNTTVKTWGDVSFYDNGYVREIRNPDISREFTIQGKARFLTTASYGYDEKHFNTVFHRDGSIEQCVIQKPETFNVAGDAVTFPARTRLRFSMEGRLVFAEAPPYEKTDLRFRGTFRPIYGPVYFHDNGRLKSCVFDETSIRNGTHPLKVKGEISFYDNEQINTCILSDIGRLTVNGQKLVFDKKPISFYSNGQIKKGQTPSYFDQSYSHLGISIPLKPMSEISFYASGRIKNLHPDETCSAFLRGIPIRSDHFYGIQFYENGQILSTHVWKSEVFYYRNQWITMETYAGRLLYDLNRNVVAFTHGKNREYLIEGHPIVVPPLNMVTFEDDTMTTLSRVEINPDNILLPEDVVLDTSSLSSNTVIFVKAKTFYNVEKKKGKEILDKEDNMELYAKDVEALMFTDEAEVEIGGKVHVCKPMEWIELR